MQIAMLSRGGVSMAGTAFLKSVALLLALLVLMGTCLAADGPKTADPPKEGKTKSRPEFAPRKLAKPFPPIVNAPTLPADKAGDRVSNNELVVGVVVGGEARAYPINMLTGPSREIINDTLGKHAIAATW